MNIKEFFKNIARNILKSDIDNYVSIISDYAAKIVLERETVKELNEKINKLTYVSEDEKYYETKYPTANISYKRNEKTGDFDIDVRKFIQPNDYNLPIITGKDDDEKALNSLKWVINNITYTPDKTIIDMNEYWMFPHETYTLKKGDCEDGAILLASIMIKNGIKPWKIRVTAGDVTVGGHAFVVYYSEENKRWILLDWCFWKNIKPIKDRIDYKDEACYKTIWFSFNNTKSWGRNADIRKAGDLLNK